MLTLRQGHKTGNIHLGADSRFQSLRQVKKQVKVVFTQEVSYVINEDYLAQEEGEHRGCELTQTQVDIIRGVVNNQDRYS